MKTTNANTLSAILAIPSTAVTALPPFSISAPAYRMIFTAVSRDGDHGYVFVQKKEGPCNACLFPDMTDDDRYPCPGTPAIADILQAVGALAVYAVDTLLMSRPRRWNYRRISLADGALDGTEMVPARQECRMFAREPHR